MTEAPKQSPSHATIRNWTLKLGYYELTRQKEKSGDWIILLDHSIQFGKEKIFVVLGVRETVFLKLKRPLRYSDLTTLLIETRDNWNGRSVSGELKKLETKIGKINYAVGDYGSDLRKGLALSKIGHIHDLSHLIALITEKLYGKDDRFIELKNKMGSMRAKYIQTDIAAAVPPKSRKKSEYQSFDKIIKWANAASNLIENKLKDPGQTKILEGYFETGPLDRIKEELSWTNDCSGLIDELTEISNATKEVETELKHNGLSKFGLEKCKKTLNKLESGKAKEFKEILISRIDKQIQILPNKERVLFSSDILESLFGKYKNRVSENPMASITALMLIIAAFTIDLNEERVKQSMENVKMEDIQKWSRQSIGVSLFQKRKVLFAA